MIAAGLLAVDISAVLGGSFYYISKPVFAFPLIKIVFLIIKLVTQGAIIVSGLVKNVLAAGLPAAKVPVTVNRPFPSYI